VGLELDAMVRSQTEESSIHYYGWVVVGACFLATLMGFGLVYSYGVFLKPLASEFGWSRSIVTGAFTFYAILHNILAFFVGMAMDKYGPKWVLGIAGFFLGFSMIILSRITSVWEFYLYFGVFFSLGIAGIYSPAMATVSAWFKAKRGFDVGLTTAGLGAGAFIFSPLTAWLISSFGWRRAYLILGIVVWIFFVPVARFIKKVPTDFLSGERKSERVKSLCIIDAFKTTMFWALGFSYIFISIALWTIMIHMVSLATDRGMSILRAGMVVSVIGGSSIPARICAGLLSDRIGRKKTFVISLIFQLIAVSWLMVSKQDWMLFTFAIIFGISTGGSAGVMPAFPADYFGFKDNGAILGFLVMMAGMGVGIGPYVGAYIYDITQSYDYMVIMCMLSTIAGILVSLILKPIK